MISIKNILKINQIYLEYTEFVEPCLVLMKVLDVSQTWFKFADSPELADLIRSRIKSEIGITISVGVSFNTIFASQGSDLKNLMPQPLSQKKI